MILEPIPLRRALAVAGLSLAVAAWAQPTSPPADAAKPAETKPAAKPEASAPESPLAPLAWLAGCWRGTVNKRDFREHWMPLRGNMMVGISQMTLDNQTLDYEYLRLEPRADGVYYVAVPSGKKEDAFKLGEIAAGEDRTSYTFANAGRDFPQRIVYLRGALGWLYVNVEGTVNGAERKIIYPMRHVDCESGEFITN